MTLEYLPNKGFRINSILFEWGEEREHVRKKLGNQHQEDDKVIEMSDFFEGDKSQNIDQKRDIFQDINKSKNYFFFSYDTNSTLQELELHWGVKIILGPIELEFDKDINSFVNSLRKIDESHLKIEEGKHLFKNLKLTISNAESHGGKGNGLSYFYATSDLSHLLDN